MQPKFCPNCGSNQIEFVKYVPRCMACRLVFIVSYTRQLRKSPGTTRDK